VSWIMAEVVAVEALGCEEVRQLLSVKDWGICGITRRRRALLIRCLDDVSKFPPPDHPCTASPLTVSFLPLHVHAYLCEYCRSFSQAITVSLPIPLCCGAAHGPCRQMMCDVGGCCTSRRLRDVT
jgi:hypothetical protein